MKSLDWAKATAEKRATLITSLDCIFAVVSIWDREREEVWRCLEKAAKERMEEEKCVDSKDTKGRYLRATRENFGLWKVQLERLCGCARGSCGKVNKKEAWPAWSLIK